MIEARNLTKKYGAKTVVDNLSFQVRPGIVTGFLGPNGAGKSTTMRLILGLDRPDSGQALIDGQPYHRLARPLTSVGALLDARWVHEKRSAASHLKWIAASNGISRARVDEVLDMVGLSDVAGKKVGSFSLGMSQRLGLAGALLGDPEHLLFDEPVNGLDPEGIQWIRQVMRRLASQGRAVLVSSHLLSEMSLTADHLVVIASGRLIADQSVADFVSSSSEQTVRVRARELDPLAHALTRLGSTVRTEPIETPSGPALRVHGVSVEQVGEAAAAISAVVYEITAEQASLEDAFIRMTQDSVEYRGGSRDEAYASVAGR